MKWTLPNSTPMMVSRKVAAAQKTPAPKQKPAGSNAQTASYGKAMSNAYKSTKTYGSPTN